ncbi:hypothetical protein C8R41DRAFT_844404 [Lentinula lateritia]|uniref:Uncharacterized protein n=1 Tax=Lentinula lateritia TaxID=40482 RepID=A0ABQ8V7M1_9AGAR|nr:hypothetical protein C8R41DRAFT_844404 [Lentinula lateritia]
MSCSSSASATPLCFFFKPAFSLSMIDSLNPPILHEKPSLASMTGHMVSETAMAGLRLIIPYHGLSLNIMIAINLSWLRFGYPWQFLRPQSYSLPLLSEQNAQHQFVIV